MALSARYPSVITHLAVPHKYAARRVASEGMEHRPLHYQADSVPPSLGDGIYFGMMNHISITYASRPDATPKDELAALAAVYALVIHAHERKKAVAPATERRTEVNKEERRPGQGQ